MNSIDREGTPGSSGSSVGFMTASWVLGALLGLVVPVFLTTVRSLGRNIPQLHIEADYLAGVVWACVLLGVVLMAPVPDRDRRALAVLWIAKCAVTLGFMLFYEYAYGLDSYLYFSESVRPVRPSPAINPDLHGGTLLIALVSWYHNLILPDSFHALKVSYSLAGLVAVYLFYRAAVIVRPAVSIRLLYLLALFPSILFWSSVLGKDPVVLLGISIYSFAVVSWLYRKRRRDLLWIGVGILVAASVRIWLAPIMTVPLVVLGIRTLHGAGNKLLFLGVVAAGAWWGTSVVLEQFGLLALQDILSMTEMQASGYGGSAQQRDLQFTGIGSLIAYLPAGMFRALFRPLPGEIMNPFGILAGIENLILLILVAAAVWRMQRSRLREPLVQWALAFLLTWASLYGFLAGNLGAAVRFKLQVLPLLLLLLLYLSERRPTEGIAPRFPTAR